MDESGGRTTELTRGVYDGQPSSKICEVFEKTGRCLKANLSRRVHAALMLLVACCLVVARSKRAINPSPHGQHRRLQLQTAWCDLDLCRYCGVARERCSHMSETETPSTDRGPGAAGVVWGPSTKILATDRRRCKRYLAQSEDCWGRTFRPARRAPTATAWRTSFSPWVLRSYTWASP